MTKDEARLVPVKLELLSVEVNTIISVLGKHPFEEVFALIDKIRSQAIPQFDAYVAATEAGKKE